MHTLWHVALGEPSRDQPRATVRIPVGAWSTGLEPPKTKSQAGPDNRPDAGTRRHLSVARQRDRLETAGMRAPLEPRNYSAGISTRVRNSSSSLAKRWRRGLSGLSSSINSSAFATASLLTSPPRNSFRHAREISCSVSNSKISLSDQEGTRHQHFIHSAGAPFQVLPRLGAHRSPTQCLRNISWALFENQDRGNHPKRAWRSPQDAASGCGSGAPCARPQAPRDGIGFRIVAGVPLMRAAGCSNWAEQGQFRVATSSISAIHPCELT